MTGECTDRYLRTRPHHRVMPRVPIGPGLGLANSPITPRYASWPRADDRRQRAVQAAADSLKDTWPAEDYRPENAQMTVASGQTPMRSSPAPVTCCGTPTRKYDTDL